MEHNVFQDQDSDYFDINPCSLTETQVVVGTFTFTSSIHRLLIFFAITGLTFISKKHF